MRHTSSWGLVGEEAVPAGSLSAVAVALVHGLRALRHDGPRPWPCEGSVAHDLGMKSRVHPKYKTKYRVGNWADYDRALVQRGDITLWISTDAIDAWKPEPSSRRGGQRKFSDHAIETALMLRLVFKFPLRQAEGFLRSVLSLVVVDLEAPDHTTLSRRSQRLDVGPHFVPIEEQIHLIVDSTGLSIVGEGEWAATSPEAHRSASWTIRSLYSGENRRRLARSGTSGFGGVPPSVRVVMSHILPRPAH